MSRRETRNTGIIVETTEMQQHQGGVDSNEEWKMGAKRNLEFEFKGLGQI